MKYQLTFFRNKFTNMRLLFLTSFLLLTLVNCGKKLAFHCGECGSLMEGSECFWMEVSGKPSGRYVLAGDLNCQSMGPDIQSSFVFGCDEKCSSGCSLTRENPNSLNITECTSSDWGKKAIPQLDYFYSLSIGDLFGQSKNDWCQCDHKIEAYGILWIYSDKKIDGSKKDEKPTIIGKVLTVNGEIKFTTYDFDEKYQSTKSGSILTPFKGKNFLVYSEDGKKVIGNKVFQNCEKCLPPYDNLPCLRQDTAVIHYQQILFKCSDREQAFPAEYTFTCDRSCASGCYVRSREENGTSGECLSKKKMEMLKELDKQYSLLVGDNTLETKYDWCACGNEGRVQEASNLISSES